MAKYCVMRPNVWSENTLLCRFMRESLIAQIRNPTQAFVKRTRAINYGNCYYFQTAEMEDLDSLDVDAACDHFNTCYKNPAEYTICLTGQIEVSQQLAVVFLLSACVAECADFCHELISWCCDAC